jgi:hypothetical protein
MSWLFLQDELAEEFGHFTWRVHDTAQAMESLDSQRRARGREASRFRVRRGPSTEQRKAKNERQRTRYHTDAEYRAKQLGYHKEWFAQNKRRTYQRERARWHTDPEYRASKLAAGRASYQRMKADPERWARLLEQKRKLKAAKRAAKRAARRSS